MPKVTFVLECYPPDCRIPSQCRMWVQQQALPPPSPSLAHKMLAASPLSFSPPPPPPLIAGAVHVARQLPKSIARVHISGRTHLDLAKKKEASADQGKWSGESPSEYFLEKVP